MESREEAIVASDDDADSPPMETLVGWWESHPPESEQAYRRGYAQGWLVAAELGLAGASEHALKDFGLSELLKWRWRPQMRYETPPSFEARHKTPPEPPEGPSKLARDVLPAKNRDHNNDGPPVAPGEAASELTPKPRNWGDDCLPLPEGWAETPASREQGFRRGYSQGWLTCAQAAIDGADFDWLEDHGYGPLWRWRHEDPMRFTPPPVFAPPELPELAEGGTLAGVLTHLTGAVAQDQPIVHALPCGLPLLDSTSGGLVRGEFLGLVGPPGCGKSTLADKLLLNALLADDQLTGIIFALETSVAVRATRLVCGSAVELGEDGEIAGCVPTGPACRGGLEAAGRLRFAETAASLSRDVGERLTFSDDLHSAGGIAAAITEQAPDVVVIDHAGLLTSPGGSQTEQTDGAIHAIHGALREVGAAGVIIAETSKAALAGHAAGLSAVRGSARLASLAGSLVTLRRGDGDGDAAPGGGTPLVAELHKSRHGRSYVQQRGELFGGLSFTRFAGEVEPIVTGAKQ